MSHMVSSFPVLKGTAKLFPTVTMLFSHKLCLTLCNPMDCSMPGFLVLHYLLELAQTHVLWIGDIIQPSHPLLSPSPPAPNPSQHQTLFQWVTLHMRWPKYWSFSFRIIPFPNELFQSSFSKEHPGLISFRMDWLDLLEVQGTLKSLCQHHIAQKY